MAASPSTVTTLDYALKEHYTDQRVLSVTLKEQPFTDMLKKEQMTGDVKPYPVIYSGGQGLANTSFATAQANKTTATGVKWNITVGDAFGYVEVGDKAIKAAKDDKGAFLKHTMTEVDELLRAMGNDLNLQMWGNGGAPFGQRSSISTNTVTLTDRFDIVNFEVGMTVVASANDGSSSGHSLRAGSTTVSAVDYEAGTVELASAAAITSFADDDYLFREGSFAGDQSQTAIVKGVEAWVPSSAPTSTAFFGVDRTPNTKLSGFRLASASSVGVIEERLRKLGTEMYSQYGTTPRYGWLAPRQWERLSQQLENQGFRIIETKNSTGTYGYDSLRMRCGGAGSVDILQDRHCPSTTGFLMDMQHVCAVSYGQLFHAMNEDGFKMLRVGDAAAYEIRYVSYPQLVCQKPGDIGRVSLPAVV